MMTSPGVFVATLGAAIIIVTLLNNAKSELSDSNLATGASGRVQGHPTIEDVTKDVPAEIIKRNLEKAGYKPPAEPTP